MELSKVNFEIFNLILKYLNKVYQNVVSKPEFGVTNVQSCKGFNLIPAEE